MQSDESAQPVVQPASIEQKQSFSTGFLAGLIAGIIASALMLLLSVTISGISLPEVFGSSLTQLMPPSLFNYLHEVIGGDAKHYFFYIILIGQCLVFALVGGLCCLSVSRPAWRLSRAANAQGQLYWFTGIILALILWLLVGLLFLPLTGAGIFGAQEAIGSVHVMISLAIVGVAYGLLFVFAQNWLVQRHLSAEGIEHEDESATDSLRRDVLRNGLALLGIGTLGVLAWRFISGSNAGSSNVPAARLTTNFKSKISPPPRPNYGEIQPVSGLSPEVTPNTQYYVVSKNLLSDPTVAASSWKMTVSGEVEKPYSLTYDEILALPTKQQYESMMCISNEVGGSYMSNAHWEGVPLADLLTKAGGVKPGATKVVLRAADDYSDSIHLSKALEPTTLVALHMNDATLPQGHGFPARLLVPGIYGMKHVKWITGIEVVNTDFQGYWQQRGWSDPAPIRLTSRIDTPLADAALTAHRPTYIAGVAFAGNKGISQVDVSLDGAQTWHTATLKQPLSALTWVLWELPWQPAAGSYTIVVRAIDMEGNVQDPNNAPPLPDGSSGYNNIAVTVK